jgi:hypothetical protein
MKDHYDFSRGVRGKFHRPDAAFRLPVYLDESMQSYLTTKGIEFSDLINDLLRRKDQIIETVQSDYPRTRTGLWFHA